MYNWTEREVEFIKSNKGKLKVSRMAKILHRSEFSVRDKINNLGLGDKRGEIKYWTENDDEFLKNNTDLSLKELSTQLGRTETAVTYKKNKLDVRLKNDIERWKKEDEKFLIDNNSSMNYREIAKDLDKTETAVRHKMVRLGIFEERLPMIDKNRWTAEEDELLIKNKDMTIKELMVMFPNRKRIAIYSRKSIIGAIKKPKEWTEEEIQIIKDNLDKSDKEIAKILDRSATSIKTKRTKLGLLKVKPNQRWTEKEEKFLVENKNMDKNELAKRFGVSRTRVHGKLIKMDLIEKEEPGVAWSDEDINIVREMVEGGASRAETVEAFPDRTVNSVVGYIRKFQPPKKEKIRTKHGFVEILINNRYVRLHRYTAAQFNDIESMVDMHVHHLSMDRKNNHPNNLIIIDKKQHVHLHYTSHLLIKPFMDAGFIDYNRSIDAYVILECKTTLKERRKIFDDFNNRVNAYAENNIKNIDNSTETTKLLLEKYGYITTTTKKWTEKEINFIKDNPNLTMPTITTILASRTKRAIRHKLDQLGYKIKRKGFLEYISKGYRIIKVDGKSIPEHIHNARVHITQPSIKNYVVHHANHDRLDNSLKNLIVLYDSYDNNGKYFSANSKHKIAEGTFNRCVANLYNRGIVAYSPEQKSYILGDNFIINDKNYKLTE